MAHLQQNQQLSKANSFLENLQSVAQDIENTLEEVLPPPTTRLHEAMRYSVLGGGKRLRSFLVLESCRLFNVPQEEALKTAAAVELIQAYSLVHDDLPCMDDAEIRRGKPSCHKVFGEATATLVGDALIPLAFQILSSLQGSPADRLALIERLAYVIGSYGLVAGQMMDLSQEKPCQEHEDIWELQHLKTSVFFSFASESGAILGSGSSQERETLRSYGLLFGQAFQMRDDWLDGCGNPETLGKPIAQDKEKLTFLNLLGPDLLPQKVEGLVQDAIHTLTLFQGRATFLKEAAESLLLS